MRSLPRILTALLVAAVAVTGLGITSAPAYAAPCGDGSLTFSGGQGTAASPYRISTEADLEALRDANTTGDYDGSTHGYYDCTYLQTRDITITGATWKHGIGFTAPAAGGWWAPFQGVYDGGGHTITNLSINPAGEVTASHRTQKLGFIGSNQSGTGALRNLNLANATITCGIHAQYAALLVGETLGSVERSSASGLVDCTGAHYNTSECIPGAGGNTDLVYLAGLVGNAGGSVSNAWVSGVVKAPSATDIGTCLVTFMGGVFGRTTSGISNTYGSVSLVNPDVGVFLGVLIGRREGLQTLEGNFAEDGLNPFAPPWDIIGNLSSPSAGQAAFKTSLELQDITTFAGWSISAGVNTNTIWGIDPAINGGYPFLQALPVPPDDPAQAPAPILQQVPRQQDGTCDGIDDRAFEYDTGLTGGWTPSWAQWARGGEGGPVCGRMLVYRGGWTIAT